MNENTDLSAGPVPLDEQIRFRQQIQEETQRLRWKTGVLIGSAIAVVVFYLVFLVFILGIRLCWVNPASTNLILGILAGVPTLLLINLVRMVAKPIGAKDSDDFEKNAWLSLGKEIVEAGKDWLKSSKP